MLVTTSLVGSAMTDLESEIRTESLFLFLFFANIEPQMVDIFRALH